jgi:(p)ppGpp synthase/HD superfamily hydrolase
MTQNKYTLEHCIYSDSLLNNLEELNNTAVKYKCDQVDITYIKKGISFAKHYHGSQTRKSGEPYYSHPIIVAEMVANHMFREHVIIAALLHDTLEDTTLTLSEIESEFSPRIAEIVDRLTRKIDPATGKKMSAGECLLKAHELGDMEAVLVKMVDRWHNTSTIGSLSKEKQEKIIKETTTFFEVIEILSENNIFSKNKSILIDESSNVLSLAFQSALNQNSKKLALVS